MTTVRPQIRVLLLVEDNPADAEFVVEMLVEAEHEKYEVVHVPCLADALDRLREVDVDVILLDLRLPDCSGVKVVKTMREFSGKIPIVVMTGSDDEHLALECLDAGAQDYLSKSDLQTQNLKRSIGYAFTRTREAQVRELQQALEGYRSLSSASQGTTITAALAGSGAVSVRSPDSFRSIVRQYFALLDPYLTRGIDRVQAPRAALERIAFALGDANGGPRDLLDVHVAALDLAIEQSDTQRSWSIVFEARLLALEMMGLLVDYYRVGHRRFTSERVQS